MGFLALFFKECNKNTGSNFPHSLARATAFFFAHTKEVSICQFSFQLLKIQLFFVQLSCCFPPRARSFTHNSKEPSSRAKNFLMPGHYKKIMPAQQPIRARVLLQPYNKRQSCPLRQSITARDLSHLARSRSQPHNKLKFSPTP